MSITPANTKRHIVNDLVCDKLVRAVRFRTPLSQIRTVTHSPALGKDCSHSIRGLSLALIGNASEQTFWAERGSRSGAFSMRRLGGSRWRLRWTRCAMGFERQPGSEQSFRGAVRRGWNGLRMVGVAPEMSTGVCEKLRERRRRRSGQRSAPVCQGTSLSHQWWTRYEESK
jgi:hypothetical protein